RNPCSPRVFQCARARFLELRKRQCRWPRLRADAKSKKEMAGRDDIENRLGRVSRRHILLARRSAWIKFLPEYLRGRELGSGQWCLVRCGQGRRRRERHL